MRKTSIIALAAALLIATVVTVVWLAAYGPKCVRSHQELVHHPMQAINQCSYNLPLKMTTCQLYIIPAYDSTDDICDQYEDVNSNTP